MKRIVFSLVLAFALAAGGCATLANLKAKKEAEVAKKERLAWWSDVLGKEVLSVEEDYSGGDVPRTRIKTGSGKELVFH